MEWERLEHLVNPVLGVVHRIEPSVGRHGLPIAIWTGTRIDQARCEQVVVAAGRDDFEARSQVVARAVSRQCRAYDGTLGADWHGAPAALGPQRVPGDLAVADPQRAVLWARLRRVGGGETRLVPTSAVFTDVAANHAATGIDAMRCVFGIGWSDREAVLDGLLRVLAWWALDRARSRPGTYPLVLTESFEDPFLDQSVEQYARLGCRTWMVDLTAGHGVPVFAALHRDDESEETAVGVGAHVDPKLAAVRAVCRLARALVEQEVFGALPAVGKPDLVVDSRAQHTWEATHALPKLGPDWDYLDVVRSRVEEQGWEVYTINQSRPGLTLRAAAVVVVGS